MSYPANPFAGASPTDPFAASAAAPNANAAPAPNGTTDGDMSLEATVPMPAIQPSPIFPTGSGPLTPMRISPLDGDARGSAPPPDAQPAGELATQDVQDTLDTQTMQEEAPAEVPDEAVTTSAADHASPDETPEISSAARVEYVEQTAPEITDEAAPETTPLRAMETKPLAALESTEQVAPANTPDDMADDMANDMANATSESTPALESSSDDVPAEDHSADPA